MQNSIHTLKTNEQRRSWFAPLWDSQTYRNIAYLLVAFPLGIAYFVFLVTGLSLGAGLLVIWIGFPILLLTMFGWIALGAFERTIAIQLLGVEIGPRQRPSKQSRTLLERFVSLVKEPVTWKSLLFLLIKFPLGVASFVLTISAFAFTVGSVTAPLFYRFSSPSVSAGALGITADTLPEAVLLMLVGIALLPVWLLLINQLARLSGKLAQTMLGNEGEDTTRTPRINGVEMRVLSTVDRADVDPFVDPSLLKSESVEIG